MYGFLKLIPSLILIAFVALVLQADPPLSASAQPGNPAKDVCQKFDPEDYFVPYPQNPTYILAYLIPDCPFRDFSVEVEQTPIPTPYLVKLRWLHPENGMPRADTYPMHAETGSLGQNDYGPIVGFRDSPIYVDDGMLEEPFTWTLGLTVQLPAGRNVGIDLTPGQTQPSVDLVSGQTLAGVLAFTTISTVTSTPPLEGPKLLNQQMIITEPTPSSTSTEELIWEVEMPVSSTAFQPLVVEMAVAGKTDQGDTLKVILVDPEGAVAPPATPYTVTSTANTFGLTVKSTTSLPSFLPATPLASAQTLKAGDRYWLVIKVEGQWSLGMNTTNGGAGLPNQRLWRRDYDGTLEELQADLAFQFIGTATSTLSPAEEPFIPGTSLSMRIAPQPFHGRTRISFEGSGQEASIRIYDLRGRTIRTLQVPMSGDRGTISWDGRDNAGQRLGAGTYLVKVQTNTGLASSRKVTLLR